MQQLQTPNGRRQAEAKCMAPDKWEDWLHQKLQKRKAREIESTVQAGSNDAREFWNPSLKH